MQAAWLLTVAFGNLIVMVVAQVNGIPRQVKNPLSLFSSSYVVVLSRIVSFWYSRWNSSSLPASWAWTCYGSSS